MEKLTKFNEITNKFEPICHVCYDFDAGNHVCNSHICQQCGTRSMNDENHLCYWKFCHYDCGSTFENETDYNTHIHTNVCKPEFRSFKNELFKNKIGKLYIMKPLPNEYYVKMDNNIKKVTKSEEDVYDNKLTLGIATLPVGNFYKAAKLHIQKNMWIEV